MSAAELFALAERHWLDEAKQLLRAQLAKSDDPAIRLINEIAEISDENPAVQKLAAALRAKASSHD